MVFALLLAACEGDEDADEDLGYAGEICGVFSTVYDEFQASFLEIDETEPPDDVLEGFVSVFQDLRDQLEQLTPTERYADFHAQALETYSALVEDLEEG